MSTLGCALNPCTMSKQSPTPLLCCPLFPVLVDTNTLGTRSRLRPVESVHLVCLTTSTEVCGKSTMPHNLWPSRHPPTHTHRCRLWCVLGWRGCCYTPLAPTCKTRKPGKHGSGLCIYVAQWPRLKNQNKEPRANETGPNTPNGWRALLIATTTSCG